MRAEATQDRIVQMMVGRSVADYFPGHLANTPGVVTEDTADMTMALILAVMRHVVEGDRLVVSSRPIKRLRIGGVMEQRIFKGDEAVAEAEVTWVSIDSTGRAAPLPPRFQVPGLWP